MNPTGNININTKTYWNEIYKDEVKRKSYIDYETNANNSKRFEFALKEIAEGESVLDIGCGAGVFTQMVKRTYPLCEVTGIDISDNVIELNKLYNDGCNYLHGYVGDAHFNNEFDFVFSGEVLEHLDDPKKLFLDAYKALKPGGKFLVTTPFKDKIRSEEHVWEFTHEDIENLYLSTGFKEVRFIYLPKLEHLLVIMAVGEKTV